MVSRAAGMKFRVAGMMPNADVQYGFRGCGHDVHGCSYDVRVPVFSINSGAPGMIFRAAGMMSECRCCVGIPELLVGGSELLA